MDAPAKAANFRSFSLRKPANISPPLAHQTDANGEAQFNISESRPENIDVGSL